MSEHEAGPELDARVAEEVFGKTYCEFEGTGVRENQEGTISEFCVKCGDPCGYHRGPPAYSTSIAAAWEVHRKMQERIFSVRKEYYREIQWAVYRRTHPRLGLPAWPDVLGLIEPADICLAALAAVEGKP